MEDLSAHRKKRLALWCEKYGRPQKEKSLFSQILRSGSTTPLGESLARRLERDYAMGDRYLDKEDSNVEPGPDLRGKVPLISWVQAGEFTEAADYLHPGEAEAWLDLPRKNGKNTYALRVRGDSMTAQHGKTYPDGCIIFVDPDQKNPVTGDRIIAKLDGTPEVTFKVFVQDAGKTWLRPLNPSYPVITDPFKVLGKVIGKWEDE